ncbi:MAG: hypothetical protein JSU97_07710 [Dehalococcoidia bacterium]|nr:MAG: hypothetical protein JSU97_07710 [Dehalococcoidia bacterium]
MPLLATVLLLALTVSHGLAQEEPSVVITAPAEGEVLSSPDITVNIALSGFTISLPLEPKREPNTGHIVYFLDVEPFFDLAVPLGEDSMIHSGRFSETFVGVADGDHTIYVCLVYDDNTCIDPALTDSVRISVGEAAPTVTPSPEVTPTPEPPQDTPTPPPTPSPTEEPPPAETPAQTETPPASPTVRPPTTVPLTPAATSIPGMAPDTADGRETDFPVWWYGGVVGIVTLVAIVTLALWWLAKTRSKL